MRRRSVRLTLVITGVVLLVLILSLRSIATFYTDYLWFREVGQSSVFFKTLTAKIGLGLIFGALFFLLVWINLYIADRVAPRYVPVGPEEELIGRYRDAIAPYRRWIRLGIAGVLGLFVGAAAVGHWSEWLLFLNRADFGTKDPQFGRDVGFLVFQLPFYEFLVNWFLTSLIFVTILVAVIHYVNGGIRFQTRRAERATPAVKVHLSVLFGVLALFKGWGYLLNQYELLYSQRGFEFSFGASATDVNAQLPALRLLVVIMVVVAILFLVNIRFRGWLLPAAAISIWVLVSFAAGGVFPLVYQRIKVQPQEAAAERPFVERNIRYTRLAYDIADGSGGGVTVTAYPALPTLTAADVVDNAVTIKNVRLWDPKVLPANYKQLQSLRNFYDYKDVDVDRYFFAVTDLVTGAVERVPQQVLLGIRELEPTALPSKSWVNLHLQFTHGYGLVMSEANSVDPTDLQPNLLIRDIPVKVTGTPAQGAALALDQPRTYYGEEVGDYVIVNTGQREFDYPVEAGPDVETIYEGKGGIRLSNLFVRAAFALRFANANPLISGQMNSGSRVMFHRDVSDRVHAVAPFLALDADPYPAIVGKRIVWIQDAYTHTGNYPYSQLANLARVPDSPFGLKTAGRVNYIRNSVKVAIDAYDGTMTFYVVDPSDAIVRAYAKIFPSLFTFTAPSEELRQHFRYPEDLFRVQSDLYTQYHVTDPDQFYRQQDPWSIPANPSEGLPPDPGVSRDLMEPYYLLMRFPEDPAGTEQFVILQPFTPRGKNNMVSFLVARSDPKGYGELVDYRLPLGTPIDGPSQVFSRINQQPEISRDKTLLNQQGSRFIQGNLLLIPVGTSILYVQPIYVTSSRQGTELPQFNRVVVVYGGQVVQGRTMDEAIERIFGTSPKSPTSVEPTPTITPTLTPGVTPLPGTTPEQVQGLLDKAAEEFRLAEEALKTGDLAEYQSHVNAAREAVAQAQAIQRGTSAPGSTETAAPPPTPGPGG